MSVTVKKALLAPVRKARAGRLEIINVMRSKPNTAGCLTAIVGSFSRLMLLMYWLAR
jgi:hypothetical protein